MLKIIDQATLDALSRTAAASPRLRQNLNMHDDLADPCQRLFNALETGTYVRPHRHVDPPRPECFLAVRGRMALIVFAGDGTVTQVVPFGAGCDVLAIELPPGTWHSLVALDPGSVFFEAKPGPYVPLDDKDFGPWSPAEGTPEVVSYLASLMAIVERAIQR